MQTLVVATKNAHKTDEIRAVLTGVFEVHDLCSHPEIPAPEETGETFAANAALKALSASQHFSGWILADDSGLSVDALQGAPGIYSARYAGAGATDAQNRERLLADLRSFSEPTHRKARFQCVLALARAGEIHGLFEGVVEGVLLCEEQGGGGFGYDSLFVPEGYTESFGVLSADVKNAISHRSRALAAFRQWIDKERFTA